MTHKINSKYNLFSTAIRFLCQEINNNMGCKIFLDVNNIVFVSKHAETCSI